jgi:hypothetical protein
VAEIGLGSAIHALRIPLGGHLLSLNQGLLLTLALKGIPGRRLAVAAANAIAFVASAMKSLSPAGQKLTPMLAIAVQGALYSAGIAVFGVNALGIALGMALLSVWGFVQPLLFAAILFGGTFFQAIEESWRGLATLLGVPFDFGISVLLVVVLAKAIFSAAFALFAWRSDGGFEAAYFSRLEKLRDRFRRMGSARSEVPRGHAVGALFDLLNPWFLVSFTLTMAFIVYAGNEERRWIYFGRTLLVAYVLFYLVRALPPVLGPRLRGKFPRIEKAFAQAWAESAVAARDRSRS